MHWSNCKTCETEGPDPPPPDADGASVVEGVLAVEGVPVVDEVVDEDNECELACGDPPPHAATPKATATRTDTNPADRQVRGPLNGLRLANCSVCSVFICFFLSWPRGATVTVADGVVRQTQVPRMRLHILDGDPYWGWLRSTGLVSKDRRCCCSDYRLPRRQLGQLSPSQEVCYRERWAGSGTPGGSRDRLSCRSRR